MQQRRREADADGASEIEIAKEREGWCRFLRKDESERGGDRAAGAGRTKLELESVGVLH